MSVLNVVLKRTPNYSLPIKSKERLIFQCGYRRFVTNPIFSQHTNGQKHKFERFFQPESTAVATFFGRIQFPPSPVLCYKEENGQLNLVATGSLLSCNPDRIILKRIVLSGL
jgi:pre-rRNA-processing protein TSR1